MEPVERFDPEGFNRPKGEWMPGKSGSAGKMCGKRVLDKDPALLSASKPSGAEELGIERFRGDFPGGIEGAGRER